MNIWDALRSFSGNGKKRRRRPSGGRASGGRASGSRNKNRELSGSLQGRGLRMEQFEERMLLSISAPAWMSNHTYMSDVVVAAVERVSDMDSYRADDLASVTQWVVGLESASGAVFKADSLGASYISEAPYLENMSIWEFPGEQNWQTVVDTLDSAEGVDFFYPLVPRQIEPMMIPDDTLFDDQWHLLNTGQNGGTEGADANVVPAWDSVLGTGVVLAIVDSGFQPDHPDLASNYRAELSWDYGQDDADPSPVWESDNHGTAVAGVAGATGNNNLGVSGSAPDVDLVNIRIDFTGTWTSAMEALVLTHEYETVDIYNNSWGGVSYYLPEGPLVPAALENAVTNGRDGLGNIYVFAAGNSRLEDGNANHFANQNSRYTIAVAAIDHDGQYSYYSNPGAALLISASSNSYISGITTTDRTGEDGYNWTGEADDDPLEDIDYTSTFGGTSSACPLVSGIVALILEANPNLTYRDVQSILVNTARMTDPGDADWTMNGAGRAVNHNYGFGAVDAAAAVDAAVAWENLSAEVSSESSLTPVGQQIPDGSDVGMVSSITLDDSVTDIEHVEITVDIDHPYPGDLEVILTSPDGTESVLANSSDQWWNYFSGNLENWTFTSTRHWGEASEGEWTLQVRDKITYSTGTWNSWSIKAYGENIGGEPGPGPEPAPPVGPELISVVPNSGVAISNGDLLHTGPRELKFLFNEGQVIDEATLGAIRLLRAGGDDVLDNANDVVMDYGWIGIGERPNEVVVRFAETLPDDLYRITIVGAGESPLMNDDGTPFHEGEDVSITFDLDLGALITAIVPQPTYRDAATGELGQHRDRIVVYFNSDTLDETSAENHDFYRLTVTGQTANTANDVEVAPQTVEYDPVTNTATLTFADDLANLGTGAFHLRIGDKYRAIDTNTRNAAVVGDTIATATDLGMLGSATTAASLIVSSEIEALPFDLEWPGAITDVGHRDLPLSTSVEAHYLERYFAKDDQYGTATVYYNFQDVYGTDPSGNILHNLISEAQKDRTREIMELYGRYLGLQAVETPDDGMTIVTGDMRALNPDIATGPGGVIGLAGGGLTGTAIMDAAEDWGDSLYGDPGVAEEWNEGDNLSWFMTAMHEIGHLLNYGHTYDLEPMTVMGEGDDSLYYAATSELVYPGDHDIVHGQHIFRPDNTDVDIYQFNIAQAGMFSAETIAERWSPQVAGDATGDGKVDDADAAVLAANWLMTGATREQGDFNGDGIVNNVDATIMAANWNYEELNDTSLLDSQLKLYDDAGNVIAANDDYYSEDSYVEVYLQPGTYYVAVSSTGNDQYDPHVAGSGIGGTTQGEYDLRVGFTPDVGSHMSDTTGTRLDGDADGTPGGVHNFWFNVQSLNNTIFVDKIADGAVQNGSPANPYTEIDAALAASSADDIVRIVGNYDREYMAQVEYDNGPLAHGLAVGDLNSDGWDDIVSTTRNDLDGTSFVSIFWGVGDGTFWPPQFIEIGVDPTAVELGDITGDGLLDILVANGGENTISRLKNLGNGTFETMPSLFVGYGPSALALGDLNGDGDLDIVSANATDNTVSVLLSNGEGGYLDQAVHAVGTSPSALALGDFDNNQRIDIAVANSGDDSINILLNEENILTKATRFTVQTAIAVGAQPMSLAAGDLTGDGTVDIVVVNTGDNNISVLSGMGDGTFAAPANYAVGGDPSAVKIAKLDNNTTLDVVVSNNADDTVLVFFTRADETLESPVEYGVGDAPGYLALSDVDNDGVIDIMTTNTAGDTISVLLDHRDSAYEIGYDILNNSLPDGRKMEVPQGVTVMIDAGAVFKLRKANIDVGSSTQGIDRSEGALQVLGTPDLGVSFTSYHNKLLGVDNSQFDVPASGGDWGGLVMRNKLDYEHNEAAAPSQQRTILEEEGIFLNYVNHANITYGGGQVAVNSISDIYNPLHMEESRPTLTYNVITKNADAAMSADPNSFADTKFQGNTFTMDYGRVGPEIHGNYIIDNSINGIFVRVNTDAGKAMDELEVSARWDDTDIVHVILENLIISGTPGGPVQDASGDWTARQDGRLAIDPGIIVKLEATRIEAEMSSQLIAEGSDSLSVVFTSLNDDRYGMGGTFDSGNNADAILASSGDWGGIHFGPVSSGSISNALIAYGGGSTPIEGRFADFNTIEIHQASVRITDSVFEYNTSNASGDDFRNGRNTATDALIFVRGAQPIIVGNTIWNNDAPAISINANSMQADQLIDWGRSRGEIEAYDAYQDNHGPLVAENRLSNNELNGMLVRGATLTTSSVWDDTDIVHVLRDEIVIPNHHTYSGLRLQSSADESLVVKLLGTSAGFTALGTPLEIDDRVGGTLQIMGMPGFPVVLTSLSDDTFGAGHDPWGVLQTNTDNANRFPAAGSWNSVTLERYVNDRNVAVVNEMEPAAGIEDDANDIPTSAQELGSLAWNEMSGDDNLRLGFDVNGFIRSDDSADVDVYSFKAEAGVEVWLDIDRTTLGLDSVIELVDANGAVFARSDNSEAERLGAEALYGLARTMDRDVWYVNDQYTTNPLDAGMRVVLPGPTGQTRTYYVRVSSTDGNSSGAYQLQVRLREEQEFAGSYINMASIHYATNGIELLGLPTHSPLIGTTSEMNLAGGANNSFAGAEYIGNLLYSDQSALQVSGYMSGDDDIDWYSFDVDLQKIQGDGGIQWPTVFDIDYADGMSRPDMAIWVYDSAGTLIYASDNSNIADDLPGPQAESDTDDLDRGSLGPFDAYLGTALLPEGNDMRYYVAVTTQAWVPTALDQPLARLEPVDLLRREAESQIDDIGGSGIPDSPISLLFDPTALDVHIDDYQLNDVVLYVCVGDDLYTVDPFTGEMETDVTGVLGMMPNAMVASYGDIAMRSDGRLFTFISDLAQPGDWDGLMRYREISTEDANGGAPLYDAITGINTFALDAGGAVAPMEEGSYHFQAIAHSEDELWRYVYAVGNSDGGGPFTQNLLYKFYHDGEALQMFGAGDDDRLPTDIIPLAALDAGGANITGMTFMAGTLYAVDDAGGFYTINNYDSYDFAIPNPDDDPKQLVQTGAGASLSLIATIPGASFSGLALGPQNVEAGAYSQMLFATTDDGTMYALDATGALQPVFINGETSVKLGGIANPIDFTTGLAFSTLDFNLWHATESRKNDDGHGIESSPDNVRSSPTPGGISYWFGLELDEPNQYTMGPDTPNVSPGPKAETLNTYGLPGGAHGTLTTSEFSLAGATPLDQPVLYFNYFLETDGQVVDEFGNTVVTDTARAFISYDGADWTLLASNIDYASPDSSVVTIEDRTGGWRQAKVNLSDYVAGVISTFGDNEGAIEEALGKLRLKFEFSTAGSMNVGEITPTGALLEGGYLRAVAGEEIIDGDQFTVMDLITQTPTIFEFDMGFSLVTANSAGQVINDGDTFTIDGTVFELTKDQAYNALNNPVFVGDGDSAADVASLIFQQVEAVLGATVTPYLKDDRVYLTGATAVTTTSAGLDVQGDAPGVVSAGTVPVTITPFMTATEVAQQMSLVMDATLAVTDVVGYYQAFKTYEDLLHMVGHSVQLPGDSPLSYADVQESDGTTLPPTQFYTQMRGKDNLHEGFYIDDVIIGYIEHGEMLTDMQPDTNFRAVPYGNSIVEGYYQLEIRTGTDYANGGIFRSFDTNDRLTESLTIEALPACDLVHGSTFTVNDGVYVQTFQFVDSSLGSADPGTIGINFSSDELASQIATSIVAAINSANLLQTKADSNVGGTLVFLADAASVDGITVRTFDQSDQGASIVEAVDLSGDGIVEIITAGKSGSTVSVLVGYIDPLLMITVWEPPVFYSVGGMTSDLEVADINGDSLLDIVTSNSQDGTVSVLLGNGDGTFEDQWVYAVGNTPSALTLADVDNDGWLDIVTANKGDNTISILYGTGTGTNAFMPHDDHQVGRAPMDVLAVDLDGDTILDIVTANSLDNNISVLLGLTGFASQVTTEVGGIPVSLAAGDLDGQNGPDVVVANRGNGTATVLLNDGTGAFLPNADSYDVGPGPVKLRLEDLDNDGNLDIVTANLAADSITARLGDGSGAFGSAETTLVEATSPSGFAVAEIDGSPSMVVVSPEMDSAFIYTVAGDSFMVRPEPYIFAAGMPRLRHLGGDDNEERDQGQIIIEGNEITNVSGWGIKYDSGTRDGGDADLPHLGSVLPLVKVSEHRLVPGVMIENNLMAYCLGGGILFSGDANAGDVPTAAVPFGRIVNNTIFGGILGIENPTATGVGIQVEENASPTILNNIISTTAVGISVDATSQTTVIGATAYQGNTMDVSGMGLGQYDMVLDASQPLFVDPASGNFYPAAGSPVIDSSLDSLEDRPELIAVRDPLGIPESPILAPEKDLLGQSRADDLTVSPPPGMGSNVFKDRGAYDRLDFIGPTASVINPLDNDAGGLDRNSAENDVCIVQGDYTEFVIQLADVGGVGIADSTVISSTLTMYVNDRANPLKEGRDYFFSYDVNTDQISLVSAMGIWESGHEYKIVLDNSTTGIRDIGDNPLRGNRMDMTTEFNIAVGHIDFGDAPDPTYQTLHENDGARHLLIGDYYLGEGVTSEVDAQFALDEDELPLWDASGDQMDDGVVFGSALVINGDVSLTITASRNGGYLDAWIDYNADGDWDDVGEHIFAGQLLGEGENQLNITIPATVIDDDGINNTVSQGTTFARFRYSSHDGGLEHFGEASDGEVEDYQVHVVDVLRDYGDAPTALQSGFAAGYPTMFADGGASHALSVGGLHLGDAVDDEIDGQPNATATGDDIDNEIDDEDGVVANNWFVPGENSTITVTASGAGYLNAWVDFNRDGDWDDAGEQIAVGTLLAAGDNVLTVPVPGDAELGTTYARFRFSSQAILGSAGPAIDGEVEDYRFLITSTPRDFGDAPLSYPTMMESGSASLPVEQTGSNNDFLLTAATAGENFNGIEILVVNESASGDEALVVYSVVDRRLTIDVDPEATTANTVVAAVNNESTFVATLLDANGTGPGDAGNDGTGLVATAGNFGETSGGFDGVGDDAARHELGTGLLLGSVVDAEIDGQASPLADGDDEHDLDDEDGVEFGDLVTGQEGIIEVTAAFGTVTGPAYLNAWIDFNQDGIWTADEQVIDGTALSAGANVLAITIPGDAKEGTTLARFRFSTDADIFFKGPAPDGEVEDYEVEIIWGNASISGYKFDDRDNDSIWDANEPGIANVKIFVDLNDNGVLDTDTFGNPTEPCVVTMMDDLSTLGTDETGFYEFRGLIGRQEAYIVREVLETGWKQTYPNATVNLPDGSHGNADGSYTVYLSEAEALTDADFGNFRRPVMFVSDIQVTEGNSGYTDLEVTVHQQGSFGDTVAIHYWTEDGTAVEALPSNDYQLSDGVLTFPARSVPERPWEQEILTKGFTNESVFHISGDYVIWQAREDESDDWEIYLFDGTYDNNDDPNIVRLTDNDTDDTDPFVVQTDTGVHAVWLHRDKVGEVLADTEVYFYDGTQTIALTNNDLDDRDPQVSDSHITWWAVESMGLDSEIFLYDISAGDPLINTINLSDNDEDDFSPQISGNMVVWTGERNSVHEIMLYDGTEDGGQPRVEQLTAYSSYANTEPQIDGNTVVWQRQFGGDNYEVYMYEVDPGSALGIPTRLTNNNVPDRYPQVSGSDIVWQAKDGSAVNDWEIMHYNTISQVNPVQLTNNNTYDQRPRICGTQVVWQGFGIDNWEVFTYELRGEDGVQNVSQNADSDWYPQVTDSMIVWRKSGDEDVLTIARAGEPEVIQTVQLRIVGDTNIEPDENFFLHIEAASSESELIIIDDTAEITILNDDGALDYGDAATPFYPTLVADDGARHLTGSGVYLCDATQMGGYDLGLGMPDSEEDGSPSEAADGDNLLTGNDEKGVMFTSAIVPGETVEIIVVASVDCTLDAWIDFNRDGDWADTWGSDREHLLDSYALTAGENLISALVPANADLGQTYARFRVTSNSHAGDVLYTGYIDNGEVEDYRLEITAPGAPATSSSFALSSGDGNDTIEFIAGDVLRLIVNGEPREFSPDTVGEIILDAGSGYDTVILRGSEDDETIELRTDQSLFQGDGYTVRITNTESVTAIGGSEDHAVLYGSAADDIAIVSPTYAKLYDLDETFYSEADGFGHVLVVADDGGYDTATLLDSAGNDTLMTGPTYAKMFGDGFYYRVESFDRVTARSDAGGTDIAQMRDSAGDDTFVSTPTFATMRGDGFYVKAENFDEVTGYGDAGGFDKATLRGSAGNDMFIVTTAYGKLSGQGFTNRAYGFEEVDASGQGGADEAVLYDSIHGDLLEAADDWVSLSNQELDFSFLVRSFGSVEANSSSAGDRKDIEDGVDFLFAKGLWEDI